MTTNLKWNKSNFKLVYLMIICYFLSISGLVAFSLNVQEDVAMMSSEDIYN